MLQRLITTWISFKFKDCEPLAFHSDEYLSNIYPAAEWLIAQETSKVLFEMFPWWKYPKSFKGWANPKRRKEIPRNIPKVWNKKSLTPISQPSCCRLAQWPKPRTTGFLSGRVPLISIMKVGNLCHLKASLGGPARTTGLNRVWRGPKVGRSSGWRRTARNTWGLCSYHVIMLSCYQLIMLSWRRSRGLKMMLVRY